ncbi:ethanolamine ammonia-lyase subunit EutC [Rhodopseudomonas sp. P2A-2r]|uniref:ethanolamine ammonia-lyase subunit EutC n=1 Tax=unclassified Rhodopseudomonas TaxID=2638247 RepID=UPI002233FBA5|nr:ethanolamine ammonia-lyase subunit EutC [Rhodopseudomonas sp. P2A-2r]UZE47718.1 ethanolamine ammonia-lyase subunit EutC [Rhodopseudomonas sp. P2A-2r]
MTLPSRPPRTLDDLKALTPARVALGRVGGGLPTRALLDFTLDHARARDAVHAPFDAERLASDLAGLGLTPILVTSQVADRGDYLKRPDLGRLLDAASETRLAERQQPPCDMVLVIGDGLSPAAVNAHAAGLVRGLLPRLAEAGIGLGPAVVAGGARVALGDRIGALLNVRMVVVLIGERPGLSAPHSLGAYLTFAPKPGLTDAERNCVSNIHAAGLSYDEAAFKIAWLARAGLARGVTGVALKDDSGRPSQIAGPGPVASSRA